MKIFKVKNIEKIYKKLIKEFESYIKLLFFSIDVKIANDFKQLKDDKDAFNKVREKLFLKFVKTLKFSEIKY
jgi:hypothetical protein